MIQTQFQFHFLFCFCAFQARLANDICAACHNSADNVTISGPPEPIAQFIDQLKEEGVFAKAVKSAGFAFHCKYIDDAGPTLLKSLEQIIPKPKDRSSRWISTSFPECDWSTPDAQQSSAKYHATNFLSPVLFYEAIQKIPKNAICIEIAATGLMQAILKRSLSNETINLSLMKRGHEDNLTFFLSSIGK